MQVTLVTQDTGQSQSLLPGHDTWHPRGRDLDQYEEFVESISGEGRELRNKRWSIEEDLEKKTEEKSFWSAITEYLPSQKHDRGSREQMQMDNSEHALISKRIQMKNARNARHMTSSKEEKMKRNRWQHRRKLKQTLQEEMKRKNRLSHLLSNQNTAKQPPNIIFILADDLGKSAN